MQDALRLGSGMVYLTKLPRGVWVRMDKYERAPFTHILKDHDHTLQPADTRNLVFVEPVTANKSFKYKDLYDVTRTGLPLGHGRVVTSTACQGRTMREGVVIDCGRITGNSQGAKDDDDWWLDLYVMLSRATRLEDLLLIRAPDLDFWAKGPPKSLRKQLATFARRTAANRVKATRLAKELGLSALLHAE